MLDTMEDLVLFISFVLSVSCEYGNYMCLVPWIDLQ